MLRVVVLIGAFLFFRAVLPRSSRWSSTAVTPYMSALDGMMSAEQVSSVLDEVTPYESWLAAQRAKAHRDAHHEQLPNGPTQANYRAISALHDSRGAQFRR
jgi:hypothetical protein